MADGLRKVQGPLRGVSACGSGGWADAHGGTLRRRGCREGAGGVAENHARTSAVFRRFIGIQLEGSLDLRLPLETLAVRIIRPVLNWLDVAGNVPGPNEPAERQGPACSPLRPLPNVGSQLVLLRRVMAELAVFSEPGSGSLSSSACGGIGSAGHGFGARPRAPPAQCRPNWHGRGCGGRCGGARLLYRGRGPSLLRRSCGRRAGGLSLIRGNLQRTAYSRPSLHCTPAKPGMVRVLAELDSDAESSHMFARQCMALRARKRELQATGYSTKRKL